MAGRVLLGAVAATWSVLIPGEAGRFQDRTLVWPPFGLPRLVPRTDGGMIAAQSTQAA